VRLHEAVGCLQLYYRCRRATFFHYSLAIRHEAAPRTEYLRTSLWYSNTTHLVRLCVHLPRSIEAHAQFCGISALSGDLGL
jgi:hypothetical protein